MPEPLEADATALIVQAWRRERPDLDVTPLEFFSRLTRLAHYLDQVRQATFSRHDLQIWEFDVLADLRRAGEPYELNPSRLSADVLISSGAMTNRIDRMEARQLVQRRDDTQDGRVVWVRLTAAGKAKVDAAMADLVKSEARLLRVLTDQERLSAALVLTKLVRPLEAERL
jgi:DNA-binding MarR family transcriptional regulator